jgi:hypothetical protein
VTAVRSRLLVFDHDFLFRLGLHFLEVAESFAVRTATAGE